MRALWIGVLAVILAAGALIAPVAEARDGKFELYGYLTHVHLNQTMKEKGNEIKSSGPGYGINLGGRYWLRDNLALGLLGDWMQDRVTSAGTTEWDFHSTGFLGTVSYRFTDSERLSLVGTAGVGPYTGKLKRIGMDTVEYKSQIGFMVGLELRSKINDRASLNGQLGFRSVNFKEAKNLPDRSMSVNGFSVGIGFGYRF